MTDYCTVADLKNHMPDVDLAGYDSFLTSLIPRASRAIDKFTKRPEGWYLASSDTIRYFDTSDPSSVWVEGLGAAPTEVAVLEDGINYTVWASTDYDVWPYNALADGDLIIRLDVNRLQGSKMLFPSYPKGIRITAKHGYAAVPLLIEEATVIQSIRWFKRGQQAFKDAGAISELGQMVYAQALDPDVRNTIDHFSRTTV